MHELSLMEAVRDQALAAARAEGASRITAISLRIGSLAGVEPEALRFAHTVVMAGTIASGAELRIEVVIASFFVSPVSRASIANRAIVFVSAAVASAAGFCRAAS